MIVNPTQLLVYGSIQYPPKNVTESKTKNNYEDKTGPYWLQRVIDPTCPDEDSQWHGLRRFLLFIISALQCIKYWRRLQK